MNYITMNTKTFVCLGSVGTTPPKWPALCRVGR